MDSNKRPDNMERITTPELAQAFIDEQIAAVKEQVGDKKVLLALSGGVDSSVVAALLIKAIGKNLVCVHVNHGLLRKGEPEQVIDVFRNQMSMVIMNSKIAMKALFKKIWDNYNEDVRFSSIRFFPVRFRGVHIEAEISK